MIVIMGQTVQAAVATELARFHAALQEGRLGEPHPLVAQAGHNYNQVLGAGKVQVSLPTKQEIAQKVALARSKYLY